MYVLYNDYVILVGNAHGPAGRLRKHAGGWNSANKQIFISIMTHLLNGGS